MESEDINQLDELNLDFPPDVVDAIQQILPSDDPFDAPDFDPVDYINGRFPAEQSLHHIDNVLEEMNTKMSSVDDHIRDVIRSLTNVDRDGRASLFQAQDAIKELVGRFADIRTRAAESEDRVREITRDIKQLDTAKRNLTTSVTTLNHLQMLVEGVEQLKLLKKKREYGEVATLLQGVANVMDHLCKYKHIPQVADLAQQVEQIKNDLEKQILQDFQNAFHGPDARRFAPTKELAEACLVVTVLDPRVQKHVLDDVIKTQLAEYEVLYAPGEQDAWPSKVEFRRKFFLSMAVEFEKTLAAMFPPSWQVPARLALAFCELTNDQLGRAMNLRPNDMDVATLLHAHKIMSELESLLARKYSTFEKPDGKDHLGNTGVKNQEDIKEGSPEATTISPRILKTNEHPGFNTTNTNKEEKQYKSPFPNAICSCFQPFLHIYIDNVDKRLSAQVDKFSTDIKNYRFERVDAEESNVMPCCGELFTIYKNVLVEYLRLGGNEEIRPFSEVLRKHLREFGTKVLRASLPRVGTALPNLSRDLNMKELTAVLAQVQTLWREGEQSKLSDDDVRRACAVLVSSEYCEEMTSRLEAKLQQKQGGNTISLAIEGDVFHAVLAESIALLVTHVESQCDTPLSTMPKMNWTPDQTGDQSGYVGAIATIISSAIPIIRHNLHTSRKYFTRFCDKLSAGIVHKFLQQLYKCRPINSVGCEQLLLDSHGLKNILLELPVVGSKVKRDPPHAYMRMVARGMARAELVLQVVMGEYSTNKDLVEKFLRLLPDSSMADFQKVLEMRGIKDKASVLEIYRQIASPNTTAGQLDSPVHRIAASTVAFSSPSNTGSGSPQHETSKIARLERMLKSRRLIS